MILESREVKSFKEKNQIYEIEVKVGIKKFLIQSRSQRLQKNHHQPEISSETRWYFLFRIITEIVSLEYF